MAQETRRMKSGEYYVKTGEILISTCRAVERHIKEPYYGFNKGGKTFVLSILMCVAFLGMQRKVGLEGNHINQDTSDNRIKNLRPPTPRKNKENRDCWLII